MKRKKNDDEDIVHNMIIPLQEEGWQTGARTELKFKNKAEAVGLFRLAKQRLLNINEWHELAGSGSGEFRLMNSLGKRKKLHPAVGDLIRIDLPGPGTIAGHGFDWVQIEAIEDNTDDHAESESIAMRVHPVTNPASEDHSTAHFYRHRTSSTFIVERQGNKVIAAEFGRNEVPNTRTDKVLDKLRNAAVAVGAMLGVSALQWKALMNGVLKGPAGNS